VVLAVVAPRSHGVAPAARFVAAGAAITLGTAFVVGSGEADARGIVLSVVASACEAAYTLLAGPVLCVVRPVIVSLHRCAWASAMRALLAPIVHGTAAFQWPTLPVAGTIAYLAVIVTALAVPGSRATGLLRMASNTIAGTETRCLR
jgi:drug/metabolite transporter (DMT)-like permease